MTDFKFSKQSPVGRWSVTVPVITERVETCTGAWAGSEFRPERLVVRPHWHKPGTDNVSFTLRGSNILNDGSFGKRDLEREVRRTHKQASYPDSLTAVKDALVELAKETTKDAMKTCDEISEAINGVAP